MHLTIKTFFYLFITLLAAALDTCSTTADDTPKPPQKLLTGVPVVKGVINVSAQADTVNQIFTIMLPEGTDVKVLKLQIPVVSGTSVNPEPSTARDYTNPVTYTLTPKGGGTPTVITIKIEVQIPKSTEKQIKSFIFKDFNPTIQASIDPQKFTISAKVPATADVSKLTPTIVVSDKATVFPASGTAQNFTNPVTYTVKAESGSTQTYQVTISKEVVETAADIQTSVDSHTFILKKDNTLWGSGFNLYGQLGDGTINDKTQFTKLLTGVISMQAAYNRSFVIKTDNSLWAFGYNTHGSLGDGTDIDRGRPKKVMENVKAVACGRTHTLILKTDNSVWVVGSNEAGQLGNANKADQMTPIKVKENARTIAAGGAQSFIITNDNVLWAFGYNHFGGLGDGSDVDRNFLYDVMGNVKDIAAGDFHSVVLKTDGTVYTVGLNNSGQLGDGTRNDTRSYYKLATDVKAIYAGNFYTLFLKNDNTLWGTGDNDKGVLGGAPSTQKLTPVKIMSNVKTVSTRLSTSFIITTDNALWAIGENKGRFGNGTKDASTTPIRLIIPN